MKRKLASLTRLSEFYKFPLKIKQGAGKFDLPVVDSTGLIVCNIASFNSCHYSDKTGCELDVDLAETIVKALNYCEVINSAIS